MYTPLCRAVRGSCQNHMHQQVQQCSAFSMGMHLLLDFATPLPNYLSHNYLSHNYLSHNYHGYINTLKCKKQSYSARASRCAVFALLGDKMYLVVTQS